MGARLGVGGYRLVGADYFEEIILGQGGRLVLPGEEGQTGPDWKTAEEESHETGLLEGHLRGPRAEGLEG